MNNRLFTGTMLVKDARSLVHQIASVADALEFLYDWPGNRRGPIFTAALRACQTAFETDYPAVAAQEAFRKFAESAGILAGAPSPLPWIRETPPVLGAGSSV